MGSALNDVVSNRKVSERMQRTISDPMGCHIGTPQNRYSARVLFQSITFDVSENRRENIARGSLDLEPFRFKCTEIIYYYTKTVVLCG